MDPIGAIGGGVCLLVCVWLVVKYFPEHVAEVWRRLCASPTQVIKKQSDEMLINMDRNVAERKARQGGEPLSEKCPRGVAIWWLDQSACNLAVALGAKEALWPAYIKDEFMSRLGRAGRGRLWIPPDLDFKGIDWKDGEVPYDAVAKDCGGVVIRRADVHHVAAWPGFLTDTDLRPIHLTAIA